MPVITLEIVAWLVILLLAIPFVSWTRHPQTKPLAAYLIFITILSVAGWITYGVLSALMAGVADTRSETYSALQLTVFGASLVAGILLGVWQIRKPPRKSPPI